MNLSPLGAEESIFSNQEALDPDFLPPVMPFREGEMKEIASSLEPLLNNRNGRNLHVTGSAGIGKTHAVRKIMRDLEEEGVHAFYVNCWTNSTGKEAFQEICSRLRVQFKAEESESVLLRKILLRTKGKPVVFCFDEIDQAKEHGFLYSALEEFPLKSVVLISNRKDFLAGLDDRIRSRLLPKEIVFREYSEDETSSILKERRKFAFYEETWAGDATVLLEEKSNGSDLRYAIRLMKLSGLKAEDDASRIIRTEHVEKAFSELS